MEDSRSLSAYKETACSKQVLAVMSFWNSKMYRMPLTWRKIPLAISTEIKKNYWSLPQNFMK